MIDARLSEGPVLKGDYPSCVSQSNKQVDGGSSMVQGRVRWPDFVLVCLDNNGDADQPLVSAFFM